MLLRSLPESNNDSNTLVASNYWSQNYENLVRKELLFGIGKQKINTTSDKTEKTMVTY